MASKTMKSNIAITGLTAAGKTTHAKISASEFGLEYFSASDLLRSIGKCTDDCASDFWVSPKGLSLIEQVDNLGIDNALTDAEDSKDKT